jgi:MFS family permease
MRTVLRALRHRNYRLYFGGQFISLVGTWMQMVATGWLVYQLTGSARWLGISSFVSRVPQALLTPLAGVLIDRWDRHRVILLAQVLSMVQALTLAVLALSGHVQVWQVIALGFGLGLVNAFDVPARQAFMIEIVEGRDDLGNAIALNSSMFNSARLIGPAVAGVLAETLGVGVCFLLNALSYLAVIWALLAMRLNPRERPANQPRVLAGLAEGLRYAWEFRPIRMLLLLMSVVSLMGTPYMVLLPKYAHDQLAAGSRGYGYLMGASGLGALCGAVYLAGRRTVLGLERAIPVATAVFSLGLVGLSCSHSYALSWLLMLLTGGGMMVQMASGNTLVQTVVDDDKRGRVVSLYSFAVMGTAPFGALLGGWLAERVGVPHTVLVGGVVSALAGVLFVGKLGDFAASIHPVYVEKGILPAVAEGLGEE